MNTMHYISKGGSHIFWTDSGNLRKKERKKTQEEIGGKTNKPKKRRTKRGTMGKEKEIPFLGYTKHLI